MNTHCNPRRLAVALLALASLPAFAGGDPATNGAIATPANRVVGMWLTDIAFGPCGGPAFIRGSATVVYSPGGTVVENPRSPTGAATQRSMGLGVWSYSPLTGHYSQRLQFDWFVNGVYNGYQTAEREALMSADGKRLAGPIRSVRYAADGSVLAEFCGSATSTRL